MSSNQHWGFYGRQAELARLGAILRRNRWFFVQIAGRRRIGKTSLIQAAMQAAGRERAVYLQIPDSDPAGVLTACNDYLHTFGINARVASLHGLAQRVGQLVRQGYLVAIDEFQYFHRRQLFGFCSHLQAEVDKLAANASTVPGGLIVLGSLHAEMSALLEDRAAPLFNRTTDVLLLDHLDFAALSELLATHADTDPARLLFFWNLFEGVPKFYRDAFEQGVIAGTRHDVLRMLFFSSSSPLKGEADNWFLRELRGRYDTLLQYVARHPGCSHADIVEALASVAPSDAQQVGGYLKVLTDRYRMIERRLPLMASAKARSGRYYLCDNFLRSWLGALQRPVSAVQFRPEAELIAMADQALADAEGAALEELAGRLYEELSRTGRGDFALSQRIKGYWDRAGVEIDLVAISEPERRIRFGTCKRSGAKLLASVPALQRNAQAFVQQHPMYATWRAEHVAIAPHIAPADAAALAEHGVLAQPLGQLIGQLAAPAGAGC